MSMFGILPGRILFLTCEEAALGETPVLPMR
jgi:hypothetical protein